MKLDSTALTIDYFGASPFIAASRVSQASDVPTQMFRKEIIREGTYHKDADGVTFTVDGRTLAHWADTFALMRENGVKVPLPTTHTNDPKANQGWVHDMFVEGPSLIMLAELVGSDGIRMSKTTDVSIFCPPELVDGKGNKYSRPITHVALCTDPVVTGLGGWEAIAASLRLQEDSQMDWTELQTALGIEADMTDENAVELILSAHSTLTTERDEALTAKTEAEQALALSRGDDKKEVDPTLLNLASENREMKILELTRDAHITPAVADKLRATFIGKDNEVLALSLKAGGDQFDQVVSALKDNDPVVLKEQSGAQVLELSRDTDKGKNPLLADADARAEAAKEHK